ncbi:MAG: lysophospholipid acyltransferase family protein [Armatimonadota bacterium]|nr:lysophospholipid acyltransferase family protein [Armatimonadota bacterium]
MKAWLRKKTPGLVATVIYFVVRAIGATIRLDARGEEHLSIPGGKIVAGWHGRSFLAPLRWKNLGWYVLVSNSSDGEIMARLFTKFGFNVLRGSTGRGGARAAVDCVRILREGGTLLYSPDGPRGPSHVLGEGTIWLAQKGRAKVIPAGSSASRRKLLKNWDRYQVPMPFARGILVLGTPVDVPERLSEERFEAVRLQAEAAVDSAEAVAEGIMGHEAVADTENKGATR